jgi:hypothetical protein
MNLFEEIYRSCNKPNYVNRRITHKRTRETCSDFDVKDELVNDLEIVMNKVISEYKTMVINKDQIIECIDEVCNVVKKNVETGYF